MYTYTTWETESLLISPIPKSKEDDTPEKGSLLNLRVVTDMVVAVADQVCFLSLPAIYRKHPSALPSSYHHTAET